MSKKAILLIIPLMLILLVFCSCMEFTSDLKKEDEQGYISVNPDVAPMITTLMFHDIGKKDIKGTTTISKEKLEETLKYLQYNNYNFLTAQQAYDFIVNKKTVPEKSVWLTFDDGLKTAYKPATGLLKKYGAKATAFIEVMQIGDQMRLTRSDLKAMADSKIWDIQSHGYNGHTTSLTDASGKQVNFYFNRFLVGDTVETFDEYKQRIKRDIKKSFDFIAMEYNSPKLFFAYPLDDKTYEKSELRSIIEACLDELGVVGIGVNGSRSLPIEFSNVKHMYTRCGIKNDSDIKKIFSIGNLGKRIFVQDKGKEYILTSLMKLNDNRYIAWDNASNYAVLDDCMRPASRVLKLADKKGIIKINGKTSLAQDSKGNLWVSNWDSKKLFKTGTDFIVKKEYTLSFNPVSMWQKDDKLFIIDPGGIIYSFKNGIETLEYLPEYKISCAGAVVYGEYAYISDFASKIIYKINYIKKKTIEGKRYGKQYFLTPLYVDKENGIIANEANSGVLAR
ncbi:MAG: polysaccharide deacetylase family protein, partial [Deltaproteobacteria bacterium]